MPGSDDLDAAVGNHMLMLRRSAGSFEDLGDGFVRDVFGVTWDRRMDRDVGLPSGVVIPEPTLEGLALPDPLDPRFYRDWDRQVASQPALFRVFVAASRSSSGPGRCAAWRTFSWTSSSTRLRPRPLRAPRGLQHRPGGEAARQVEAVSSATTGA